MAIQKYFNASSNDIFPKNKLVFYSIIFLSFILLGFSLYSNTYTVPFIYDDISNIKDNIYIRITQFNINGLADILKSPSPRPLANFSFALNYYFDQYHFAGYHLVNICVHIINGFLLFITLKTILGISGCDDSKRISKTKNKSLSEINRFVPFLAAIIWFVHPLNTQSITYIVQRMNLLASMFYLISILCYIKGRILQQSLSGFRYPHTVQTFIIHKPWIWFFACIISASCAMASKQNTAMLPFLIFLFEWFFFQNLNWNWLSKRYFLFLFLFVFAIILLFFFHDIIFSIYDRKPFTLSQRLFTEIRILIYYIGLICYPHPSRMNLIYDYPISISFIHPLITTIDFIAIAALGVLTILSAKKNRLLSFSILYFFGNLAIESSFIGIDLIYEHRTYLPSMMPIFLFTIFFIKSIRIKWVKFFIGITLITVLSIWTFQRNLMWKDDRLFWKDCIQKSPNSSIVYNNLAKLEMDLKPLKAERLLKKAIQLDAKNIQALFNIANIYIQQGKDTEAIKYLSKLIIIRPDFANALFLLADLQSKKGELDSAYRNYLKTLKLNPDSPSVYFRLAGILFKKKKYTDAISYYLSAIKIKPDFLAAQYYLAVAYRIIGKVELSIKHYQIVLNLNNDLPEVHNDLGTIYASTGKYKKAAQHFSRAIQLNPNFQEAKKNLSQLTLIQNKK